MCIVHFCEEMLETFFLIDSVIEASVPGARLPSILADKPLEIRTRHLYVNVVVPRDEAMVTHCAYQGSVGQ